MSSVEQDHTAIEQYIADRLGEEKLQALSQEGLETVREKYREALEEYDEEMFAAADAFREFNFENYVASASVVDFVTIGANGPRPFGGQDAIFLYGAAVPDGDPMGTGVLLIAEEDVQDVTLEELVDQFTQAGKPFELDLSCRSADNVSDAYILEIPEDSSASECIEEPDPSDVPPEGDRIDRIRAVTDEADILNIGSNLSLTDENGYPADFGVDIKRVEPVSITSSQVTTGGARYEMQDDSFLDAEMELDETITGTEDKSAGLVGWATPNLMAIDTGSMCESVYGTVKTNNDGQVQMSIVGYEPKNVTQAEIRDTSSTSSDSGSSDNASGDSIEDRTI
jgi:hypothetical protein